MHHQVISRSAVADHGAPSHQSHLVEDGALGEPGADAAGERPSLGGGNSAPLALLRPQPHQRDGRVWRVRAVQPFSNEDALQWGVKGMWVDVRASAQ
jgi:hypothetical protein